jgi:pilus assembly protein CpaC
MSKHSWPFASWFLALLLLSGLSLRAFAAEPLYVELGTHKLLRSSAGVARVAVGNPAIADVSVVNRSDVLVVGKGYGTTSLMIWAKKSGQPIEYRVRVGAVRNDAAAATDPDFAKAQVNEGQGLSGQLPNLIAHRRARAAATAPKEGAISDRSEVALETQVQTDVRIAEISRSTAQQFGFNLFKNSGNTSGAIAGPGSFDGVGGGSNGFSFLSSAGFLPLRNAYSLVLGSSRDSIIGLLSVLESKGLARTLAEPSLVAMSGQTATYLAGGEFPVPVVQSGNQAGGITIDYKEFGVRLALTPTVLARNRISLKVAPEVSDLDFSAGIQTGGVAVPALLVRRTDTTVELGDGESFVISGLVSSNLVRNLDKVPWLGDVPVLGAFFRSTSLSREDKELIMVVTPRLVRPLAREAKLPPLPGSQYDGYRPRTGDLVFFPNDEASAGFSR